MNRRKKIIIFIIAAFVLVVGAFEFYVSNPYKAVNMKQHQDEGAVDYEVIYDAVEGRDDITVYSPENPIAGFIFYPGGKVESDAYDPLMRECASRGIFCVLLEVHDNLAILDSKAADGVIEAFPEVYRWFIGGHSLGGVVAASYAYDHSDQFDGLVLMASYSTKDLSGLPLSVLSIYGSEDKVLDMSKYEEHKDNLGDGFTELVIEGGNHAGFGSYGEQDGDGKAKISTVEQMHQTAEAIFMLMARR
ncbi:MAG: alpha/beta hydrolase [Firmicutes bacterium]|nr:alpha/beta hydrolase [Bacillota bacterium]